MCPLKHENTCMVRYGELKAATSHVFPVHVLSFHTENQWMSCFQTRAVPSLAGAQNCVSFIHTDVTEQQNL